MNFNMITNQFLAEQIVNDMYIDDLHGSEHWQSDVAQVKRVLDKHLLQVDDYGWPLNGALTGPCKTCGGMATHIEPCKGYNHTIKEKK